MGWLRAARIRGRQHTQPVQWRRFQRRILLVALVVSACGPGTVNLAPPEAGARLKYHNVQKRWTREARVHESFDTVAAVHATYRSSEFIQALEQEFQRVYRPTAAEIEALSKRNRLEQERESCFFIALMTSDREWNNLAVANSAWRVYLQTSDGKRVRSRVIRGVKAQDPVYTHFYPFYGLFFEGYEVCFPRFPEQKVGRSGLPTQLLHPGLEWFELQLRSPMAELSLRWNVK